MLMEGMINDDKSWVLCWSLSLSLSWSLMLGLISEFICMYALGRALTSYRVGLLGVYTGIRTDADVFLYL